MNKPAFNFLHVTDENSLPRTGTKLQLMYIEDIHKRDNTIMFTQMCDAGYRMVRENEDYTKWNQCVFEDIDYKRYMETHEQYIDPKILYEQLHEWLYNNYRDIYYYSEMSRSYKGYHVIFYFKVQRTKNNRMMCKALTNFIIHQAFNELGYNYIIECDKVYDDCADSFYQPCFFTLNDYNLNKECNGLNVEEIVTKNYYSIKSIYENLYSKSHKTRTTSYDGTTNWETEYMFDDKTQYNGEYLNHHERYYLFKSIVGMCGIDNEEEINKEWENCALQLVEGNNHNRQFYCSEPYHNKWINWIRNNEEYCYIDTELLSKFGYNINFKNINEKTYENTIKKGTTKVKKEKVYI